MKTNNCMISIIIPVYNGSKYIRESIDSALSQTYSNVEVIVINDGSTDDTDQICLSYGDKIKYFTQKNGGVSSALNNGIRNMKGEYFSWLSHDDLYLPHKVESQINLIKEMNGEKIIISSDYVCMNAKGKDYSKPIKTEKDEFADKPEYFLLRGRINGITLLIPKKAFDDCGFFDENLKCTQDYDMWFRMNNKGYSFIHLDQVLAKSRIHASQSTQKNPLVLSEGTNLWENLIETVSDKRKIELEGSIFDYYYQMAVFLSKTPYKENFIFCVEKCKSIDKEKYKKEPLFYNKLETKNIFKKLFFYYKNQGIIETIKIIGNRLFRRSR